MTIRSIHARDDLGPLAHLHASCFREPWSESALRDLLKNPDTAAFAGPAGFIMLRVASDESEILTLAVAGEDRRKGRGSALVLHGAKWAYAKGAARMFLEVSSANRAAIALYGKFGFRTVGERRDYYGPSEDALTLRADLPLAGLEIPKLRLESDR